LKTGKITLWKQVQLTVFGMIGIRAQSKVPLIVADKQVKDDSQSKPTYP
jgi:hypothetical protein